MKIMVIAGSPTAESRTRGIAQFAAESLKQMNVEVLYFDVGMDKLPLFTGDATTAQNETVKKLAEYAEQADGFFVTSPEYHSGISGALKNALDFLGGKHFKNKPSAIAVAAGGGKGGMNALTNLRTVLRGVYSLVLPDQFVADPVNFDEGNVLVDELAQTRVRELTLQLKELTEAISVNQVK
ncbi:NADPH-dependent FMN reductase [Fictibacillus phosphorivorans]|uniref:NADPH-dependent FMN reductase n=1 Tax=Fictibacillus phosphorivorans TaxID=1221500 RepID=UPI001293E231|nr:NADPH-dependent FMN reductase [Fictibacillus phosphorivorans]MQR96163.1 NAD(P)H-dependent oxidoreductase [Fictibacillus phosphorivorans]